MTDNPLVQDFATDWDHSDPQWVADPTQYGKTFVSAARSRTPIVTAGLVSRDPRGVSEIAKDTTNFTSRNVVIGNGRPTELDLPAPIVWHPRSPRPPFHAIARRLILRPSRRDRSTRSNR